MRCRWVLMSGIGFCEGQKLPGVRHVRRGDGHVGAGIGVTRPSTHAVGSPSPHPSHTPPAAAVPDRARKNLSAVKSRGLVKDSNLKGEGLTLGGVAVYKRGGERVYTHAEKTFGDIAPVEEILAAAQRAAA